MRLKEYRKRILRVPSKISQDPELRAYFEDLTEAVQNLQDALDIREGSLNIQGDIVSEKIRVFDAMVGRSSGQIHIDGNGALRLLGKATVWDDQQVNISSVRLPASGAPTWEAYKGCYVLQFADSATNTIYFIVQLTHKYKDNTKIKIHIHYVPEDDSSGNFYWQFTHSWADVNEVFPSETTVNATIAAPEIVDNHSIGAIETMVPTPNKGLSSIILCSLARLGSNGADTFPGYLNLIAVDFHIETDKLGSNEEYHN